MFLNNIPKHKSTLNIVVFRNAQNSYIFSNLLFEKVLIFRNF